VTIDAGGPAGYSPQGRRAPVSYAGARRRRSCSSRRPAMVPRFGTSRTGSDRYRRSLYTFRFARCRIRCSRRSTRPTRLVVRPPPRTLEYAPSSPHNLERTDHHGMRAGARHAGAHRRGKHRLRSPGLRIPPLRGSRADEAETSTLLDLLHRQIRRFEQPGRSSVGRWRPPTPPDRLNLPAGATPPQLAAWTTVARVLLNLDETITKE